MRKSLWIMLAVLFVAIGPPDARADDSVVTLDVSGTMSPVFGAGTSCAPSPCKLGGDIVIANALGIVISVDITLAGASPSVAPFNQFYAFDSGSSLVQVINGSLDILSVGLSGNPGTLVGYTGGQRPR